VLCGIGGKTIAEAKRNLSFAEVMDWSAYRRKRGTLNLGRRVEVAAGLIAVTINRIHGGKAKLSDYTPHENHDDEDVDGTITDILKIFKAVPNNKRKRYKPGKK
jgi:hypothetical protein